jgi:hypothetical protein
MALIARANARTSPVRMRSTQFDVAVFMELATAIFPIQMTISARIRRP